MKKFIFSSRHNWLNRYLVLHFIFVISAVLIILALILAGYDSEHILDEDLAWLSYPFMLLAIIPISSLPAVLLSGIYKLCDYVSMATMATAYILVTGAEYVFYVSKFHKDQTDYSMGLEYIWLVLLLAFMLFLYSIGRFIRYLTFKHRQKTESNL
jgi:hypothetical protein